MVVAALSCQKPEAEETPSEIPPTIATFESLFTSPVKSSCGASFTTPLKIRAGHNIGSVTVTNDALYLYLTYNLEQNWYLVDVQTYAGTEAQIPKTGDGNPNHDRFPGKQGISPCDMRQSFTFRVALTSLQTESEADCEQRFFIAMRASVRHIANAGGCTSGEDEVVWAAPILINPNRDSEWATAFYYCLQDCPPPPPAWCAYGQGYWFASGKHPWGSVGKVTFGTDPDPAKNLVVTEKEGVELWAHPGKRTTLQKAFFQASALQLSMTVMNNGDPIPDAIKNAYTTIYDALKGFNKLGDLKGPLSPEEEEKIQNAAGAIGKWICANNCNLSEDPTACTP